MKPEIQILIDGLSVIAAWGQGKEVDGSFDEPHAAKVARATLARYDAVVNPREEADPQDLAYHNLGCAVSEHFEVESVLHPTTMVKGRSYRLSPGQRRWLKEQYGMTPAQTVTVYELGLWEGTDSPRRLGLRSDEHIHSGKKHVLVSCMINTPGRFFSEASALDQLDLEMVGVAKWLRLRRREVEQGLTPGTLTSKEEVEKVVKERKTSSRQNSVERESKELLGLLDELGI